MFSDELCHRGTVLITGGLGGIGLALAKWMLEKRNVRHIVLLARQNENEIDENSKRGKKFKALLGTADKYSACIKVVKADVSNYKQIQSVIDNINSSSYPVRGVIHGALILRDSLASNMTKTILIEVLRARILGAWNLHRALYQQSLAFFILLSSLRNHVIDVGGANYNATNQFFDSLAHWRTNTLRFPTLSISVPAVFGTDYVETDEQEQTRLHRVFKAIPLETLFELIEYFHYEQEASRNSLSTPIIFAIDWNLLKNQFDYRKTARIGDLVDRYMAVQETNYAQQRQSKASSDTSVLNIDATVHQTVAKIFGSENIDRVDKKKPLFEQGMDSLMAVSLHNWLGAHYSVFIPVVDITQGMSINDLVARVNIKLAISVQKAVSMSSDTTTAETTHTVMTRLEKTAYEQCSGQLNLSSQYRGTDLIICFPTISTDMQQPVLFCLLNCTETSGDENILCTKIASRLKCLSQLCLLLQRKIDDETIQLTKEYIIQMRRIQPRGKYYIMGYKAGVAIAHSICSAFEKYENADVQLLVLPSASAIELTNGFQEKEQNAYPKASTDHFRSSEMTTTSKNGIYEALQYLHNGTDQIVNGSHDTFSNQNEEKEEIIQFIEAFFTHTSGVPKSDRSSFIDM